MADRDEEPTETVTETRAQAAEETEWMAQNWIRVAVVSIAALLVLVVGLMQASGLIDLLAPFVDSSEGQWIVFAVLALVVLALGIWAWAAPRERRG